MRMPTHMFISLGNILATQFKKEAESQEEQQSDSISSFNLPNIRQSLGDLSNNLTGKLASLQLTK